MTDKEIGILIRDARKKVGLTQSELAEKLGITWEMVSRYERGKSSALTKLLDIASILGVPPAVFFADSKQSFSARQSATTYITETFVPILSYVPSEITELMKQVHGVSDGIRVSSYPNTRIHFAVKLGEGSNVRIATNVLLPKGIILCRFIEETAQAGDTVLVSRGGLISVDAFPVLNGMVLARVVEWVVKM